MTIGQTYNINELAEAIGINKHIIDTEGQIKRISIDSRKIFSTQHVVFIALKGKNWDAHDFIDEAYDKGIRSFIIENTNQLPDDANVIYVEKYFRSKIDGGSFSSI